MRALTLTLLIVGCGHTRPQGIFEGLGNHQRRVATASRDAQAFFDQGMAFLYAFNHDEAIRSFTRATELDPSCAMCFWGIAIANGPHINNPAVDGDHAKAALLALSHASATGIEGELIDAQKKRFADPAPVDRKALDSAYANAMREVWQKHPNDADAGALFAESLMDLRPWDLWTADGQPQPETPEIVGTLEKVLAFAPLHPLANHLYIHAVEASPHPEKADGAADRLRDLEPALGHLVHMPSHIDVRRGRWKEAVTANEKAIEADRKYRERVPQQGFYRLYMLHNRHMLSYAEIMRGNADKALAAIKEAVATVPEEWVRQNAALIDGFMAMPLEVQMRFGRWDEVLAQPEYPEDLPIARALRHAARGVAFAAKNDLENARNEQKEFLAARRRVPAEGTFGNNSASDLLNVAEHLLNGEIAFHDDPNAGLAELRAAVEAEDKLRYDEPPDWIQPTRHALGAALLKAGRASEAEAVYREDLRRLPENGWGLWGLARSLELQKKDASDAKQRFEKIWVGAPLSTSCFCVPGV